MRPLGGDDMNTEASAQSGRSMWERHFQTFVGLVMMGLGAWLFDTVSNQTVIIAVQTEKIVTLTNRFVIMEKLLNNRYTASDAERDFELRDREINRLKLDIIDLKKGANRSR
jgi:hypothetical protein